MTYFNMPEFMKLGGHFSDIPISVDVADKIHNIITELNPVRHAIGKPVIVTSSYRPYWWEIAQGRNGGSEHVFNDKGAVDLTCFDIKSLFAELKNTKFTRICVYPAQSFIHCDYKFPDRGQRFFLEWEENKHSEIMELL